MIHWVFKYGFVVLLFNTVLLNIAPFSSNSVEQEQLLVISETIFQFIMFGGILFLIINPFQIKNVILHKSFLFLFLLNIINLLYYIFLENQYSFVDKSSQFLMARFLIFSLISLSIYHNIEYFKKKFFHHLVFVITFFTLVGLFFVGENDNRYSSILWNANMLSSLTGIAFSIFLLNTKKYNIFSVIILIILITACVSTGTRSVFIYIAIALFYAYGFSIRNILYAIIGISLLFFIQHRIFVDPIDRFEQWSQAIDHIIEKPLTGYGLGVYEGKIEENVKLQLSKYGAHNAYLSLFMQYGLFFGGLVIFIILRKSIILCLFFKGYPDYIRIYSCIIVITLIASFGETLITGINEFQTLLFWFSLSILSFTKYNLNHEN